MAKRKQPRRQGSKGTPAWAWLLVGLFVGALVFIGYRQYLSISAEPAEIPVPKGAAASGGNGDETASEPEASSEQDGVLDTDYSFYDVLPTEENTDIPADPQPSAESATDAATTGVQTPVAEAAPASDTSRYLLQAGAFAWKARKSTAGPCTACVSGRMPIAPQPTPPKPIWPARASRPTASKSGRS
jgi:hypothetical protein